MDDAEKITRKLQSALKLSGFVVRRELCSLIVEKCTNEDINLYNKDIFETCIKKICNSLEKQCLNDRSIEKEHVECGIKACLRSTYDKQETIFDIIDAFNFPKLYYDDDRKLYLLGLKKSKLLSDSNSKAQLFIDRYTTVMHRTHRNFKNKFSGTNNDKLTVQTVDYLLTVSCETLRRTLILGSLLQVSEGKYYLEDPTGIVELDLTHAKYSDGFFVENCFVIVNGYYEDKILHVSTIALPPGEEYNDSRPSFGTLNYFGGASTSPLRECQSLGEYMRRNPHKMMLFFSDVWLDHPMMFEKLEVLFDGMQASPPVAFVFMGNFMSESYGSEGMETLKKLFKQFGELISQYSTLLNNSKFVFVPGMADPCTSHIVPRFSLPTYISEEMKRYVPNAIFTTNPCRLQYCTREIVLFRADVLVKLMQGTLHKPQKEQIADSLARTIVSQGHLSPLSLNALTVHWDFDYTLRLYPLPDIVIIGDKSDAYEGQYKGCQVINPGSFCEAGFQFKCYVPLTNTLDDCIL